MKDSKANERRYFLALQYITRYMSPKALRANAKRMYGLSYEEALEMAYDNVLAGAKRAIKGKRYPKEQEGQ